jgi:hypothetical protein
MRKSSLVSIFLAMLACTMPVKAQDEAPKAELYVGYDYARVNSGDAYDFNGGSGQLTYNVHNWLGIVGDLGGYYTGSGARAGIISYLFGPRISLRKHRRVTPFAQVLFGGARSIDNSPMNAFAMTAGGGIDFQISEHFTIRPAQAEYFLTRFTDGTRNRQNNFRYSAGIVFRFGSR